MFNKILIVVVLLLIFIAIISTDTEEMDSSTIRDLLLIPTFFIQLYLGYAYFKIEQRKGFSVKYKKRNERK